MKVQRLLLAAARNRRTLRILLPPSYSQNPLKRYPVLYMHDGQNLLRGPRPPSPASSWQVDETANALVDNGQMDEVIVVGIDNTGPNRIYEYTPCCDPTFGGGARTSTSASSLESVKPWVDQSYRTLPSSENTAMMGSSLGGLVSFYLGRATRRCSRRWPACPARSGGTTRR